MADTFDLVLDVTAPGGVAASIAGGAAATVSRDVVLGITTTDPDTTGYQVKIYGDVDDSQAPTEYRAAEGNAPWVSFAATKNIRLSSGDGSKTVTIKVRDDVNNTSSAASDSITLDATIPVVSGTGPVPTKISKQTGKDESVITWQVDTAFVEYKVKVVSDDNAIHSSGTLVPTTGGSENTSATGSFPATTNIETTINGVDLETAGVEGTNKIKVFAKDAAGNWSV